MCSENRELNQSRTNPDRVDRPVRTAYATVHHCNGTQYCNTESGFLIFPFHQTNITPQMWESGGNAGVKISNKKRKHMRIQNNQKKKQKNTASTWPVITWTLSHIITISFCLNLHDILTRVLS